MFAFPPSHGDAIPYGCSTVDSPTSALAAQPDPEANLILRTLPAETRQEVIVHLDMFDLLAWGGLCSTNRTQVAAVLQERFRWLVAPMVTDFPQLHLLIEAIRLYRVIVIGAGALHLFGQETRWNPGALELSVPSSTFTQFTDFLVSTIGATQAGINIRETLRMGGMRSIAYFFVNGHAINVIRSATESPLLPVTRSWSTLLMNWVGPDSCGSAYPFLTCQRAGLVVDMPFGIAACGTISLFSLRGYTFHAVRNNWPSLLTRTINCNIEPWHCAARARTFTDGGSLLCIYSCPTTGSPTFPPVPGERSHITWRLCDETVCPNGCHNDIALPQGLLALTQD